MTLARTINPMPEFVEVALKNEGLAATYADRPPYQRNDYLGWIARAKREATKAKRLRQMLDELAAGNAYMGMKWRGKAG